MCDREEKEKLNIIAKEVTGTILGKCEEIVKDEVTKLLRHCWKATEALMSEVTKEDETPEKPQDCESIKCAASVKIETEGIELTDTDRMELANFIANLVIKKHADEGSSEDEEDDSPEEEEDEDEGDATLEVSGVKISIS